jgi:nucleolar MIF4G domain-containing protein 1
VRSWFPLRGHFFNQVVFLKSATTRTNSLDATTHYIDMSWSNRREPDRRTALSTTVLGRLGISATPTSNQSRPKFKASRKELRKQQRQSEKQQRQQRIVNKHQSKKNDSPAAKSNQPAKVQRVVVKAQPKPKQPDSESDVQSDDEPAFESDGDDDIDHELLKVSKKLGIDKNPAALQKGGSVYNEFALDGLDILNDLFLEYDARKKKYSADDYKKQLGGSTKDSTSIKEKKSKEKESTKSSVGRNLYGQPTAAIPNPDLSNQSNKRKADELSDDEQDSFDEENSEFEDDDVDQDDSEQDGDAFGLEDFDMSQLEAQSGDSDEQSDEDQEFDSELESNESDQDMDDDSGNGNEQSEDSEQEQPKAVTKTASASAYVPPHLRNKTDSHSTLSAEDQRQQMLLKRRVQGLYNKLTEGNIDSIATELRGIYAENARRLVNTVLCDSLIATCSTPSSLVPALLMAAAALITSLNNAIGVQVGAMFVEHVAHSLRDAIEQNESVRSSNLVLLMTHFYNFQLVDCVLIYSMIEHLCKRFSEVDIELLLILLKYCGTQLRKDDPAALKDIITTIQTRAKALIGTDEPSSSTSAAAPTLSDVATLASKFQNKTKTVAPVAAKSAVSFRVQVMLDMIYDLKNNKKRQVDVTDALQSLQKWLLHLNFRTSS